MGVGCRAGADKACGAFVTPVIGAEGTGELGLLDQVAVGVVQVLGGLAVRVGAAGDAVGRIIDIPGMGVFAGVKNIQQAQFNVWLAGVGGQWLVGKIEPVGIGDALGHIAVGVIALQDDCPHGVNGVAGPVERVVNGADTLVVGCGHSDGHGARNPAGDGCGKCRAKGDVAVVVIDELDDIAHAVDSGGEAAIAVINAAVNAVHPRRGLDQGPDVGLGERQAQGDDRRGWDGG